MSVEFNCLVLKRGGGWPGRGFWTDTLYEKSANSFNEHFQLKRMCFKSRKKRKHGFFLISGSSGWKYCKKSFLFSLVNPSGAGPTLLPLKGTANQNGIYCSSGSGPTFGAGYDLYIADRANANSESFSNLGNSYQCPPEAECETFLAGQKHFVITELEVFVFF